MPWKNSKRQVLIGWLAALLISNIPINILANPKNGNVVRGSAEIVQESAKKLSVSQHTDKAVINWQSFSIDADEHTHFAQPSSNSIALNRVTGNDPSAIFGRLSATGKLMLVNRNGILFGRDSRIDVNALVATTHDIRDDDFMAGHFNFNIPGNPLASVINEGSITAAEGGLIALVAPGVGNSGIISARLGRVALASTNSFTLDLYGDQLINFSVDSQVMEQVKAVDGTPLYSLVDNNGEIFTDGGSVLLSANAARDVVGSVINTTGIIQARSVGSQNGEIVLRGGDEGVVSVAGSLDVTGANGQGGRIQVTGEKVGLFSGANLDASGKSGGGTVLVGGDYRGGQGDPEKNEQYGIPMETESIPTAQFTYMAQNASIKADALSDGDGGKIIVWADDTAQVYGSLSARGGTDSGDGGFIETSGKIGLDVRGAPDASAANGVGGTWLLDPSNVVIRDMVTSNGSFSGGSPNVFTPSGDNSIVNTADIEAALNTGTSVHITTDGGGNQVGTLTVRDAIDKTAGGNADLKLHANSDLTVMNRITSTSGKLNLEASSESGDINVNAYIHTYFGDMSVSGNRNITVIDTNDATGSAYLDLGTNKTPANIDIRFGNSSKAQFSHDGSLVTFPSGGTELSRNFIGTAEVRITLRGLEAKYQNNAVTMKNDGPGNLWYRFRVENGIFGAQNGQDGIAEFVGFNTFTVGSTVDRRSYLSPYFEILYNSGGLIRKEIPTEKDTPAEVSNNITQTSTQTGSLLERDLVPIRTIRTSSGLIVTLYDYPKEGTPPIKLPEKVRRPVASTKVKRPETLPVVENADALLKETAARSAIKRKEIEDIFNTFGYSKGMQQLEKRGIQLNLLTEKDFLAVSEMISEARQQEQNIEIGKGTDVEAKKEQEDKGPVAIKMTTTKKSGLPDDKYLMSSTAEKAVKQLGVSATKTAVKSFLKSQADIKGSMGVDYADQMIETADQIIKNHSKNMYNYQSTVSEYLASELGVDEGEKIAEELGVTSNLETADQLRTKGWIGTIIDSIKNNLFGEK